MQNAIADTTWNSDRVGPGWNQAGTESDQADKLSQSQVEERPNRSNIGALRLWSEQMERGDGTRRWKAARLASVGVQKKQSSAP